MTETTAQIDNFHAHIYFDAATYQQADQLCQRAGEHFDLTVGQMLKKPVGPHPMWSCQLLFKPTLFGEVIPWLALNRNGLIVFIHATTGDHLKDHTDHAIWMGEKCTLDLSIFN